ncbi:PREDICTED: uncharacterized protein LOC105458612 [Wasmannia auropunctata]|uniref:uncharacterized protein LOC105458612 n=1 Tax=Wasmannia auropunctata TaxID=64793 RepID=UPI0005EE11DF|nr:PREDICTED: uncharacterized protein LOC105458612 [Wasmannia auropunctata]
MTLPILLQERDAFYFVRSDSSIMRLRVHEGAKLSSRAELEAHKYESAAARMLLHGHVYTSDRAELRIVSQTPRELSLYSGSNSVDSEDRRMIDGIASFLPAVRLCTFQKNGSFVDCSMTETTRRRSSGTNRR